MGDRAQPPRRRPPLPGDLRAEPGPGPAGRVQAHHRQPDQAGLDAADAQGRARPRHRGGHAQAGGRARPDRAPQSADHHGTRVARRSGSRRARSGPWNLGLPGDAGSAGPGLALRAVRRLAAGGRRAGRARPQAAGAAVAAGVRPPDRGSRTGRGAGREGPAARRGRPRGADARHRPAVPVPAARRGGQDAAHGVRGPPGPPEPGPLGRPARPAPAAPVAGGRRRPGVAAAVRGHRRPRRNRDRPE